MFNFLLFIYFKKILFDYKIYVVQEPTPVSLRKESSSVMELMEITIGPEADPPSLLSTVQEQPGGVFVRS
jgi:hypothetical protein